MPDYSYAYDPRGPLSRKTETPPAGDPVVTAYAYDAAGRLSFEYRPSDPAAHLTDYSWDPAGRMVSASGERGISSLAWDGLSRLVSAATPGDGGTERVSSYAYDHLGRMLAREEREDGASSSTLLLPFALTRETAALYDPEGEGPGALLFSFLSGPSGTRLAQTDHRKDPGETTHPFRSPRGDVLALLDRDGNPTRTYAYSPYGETEEGYSEEGTPFLFQDDYLDPETSLYHMQARWYDPCSSSFLSPDPEMGEAQDPQARLPYAYCAGDPVYNSDPSGRTYMGDEDDEINKTPLGRLAALLGYSSVAAMLMGQSEGNKRPLAQAVREKINKIKAEKRAGKSAAAPNPEGTYIGPRERTIFEPDYDRYFWHDPWFFENEPKHESYPNTYTEWKSVPVNTSSRDWRTSLRLLSAIAKGVVAVFAAGVGLYQGALDVGASAIEDVGYAVTYFQPVGIAWCPYFYAPRRGGISS
ncbi:MAG: RHS repeat-associated core domain-containing protein [Actinobacteria bacterium]|nr:RHS repeat-associated core domain-containing protein [Actinomycetota bacterium]